MEHFASLRISCHVDWGIALNPLLFGLTDSILICKIFSAPSNPGVVISTKYVSFNIFDNTNDFQELNKFRFGPQRHEQVIKNKSKNNAYSLSTYRVDLLCFSPKEEVRQEKNKWAFYTPTLTIGRTNFSCRMNYQ